MRGKLTELVMLNISKIFDSEKPILKVNILMTGIILLIYGALFST